MKEDFREILEQIGEMHDKKSADYGNGNDPYFNLRMCERGGLDAWKGVIVRLGDKYARLLTFMGHGELKNESVEDAFMDMAVYAILGLVLFREKK